jgi:hypothetical protein
MSGYDFSNGNNSNKLGKITEPYKYCDPTYVYENFAGQQKYTIIADCCQCGLFCRKCAETVFFIYNNFISSEFSSKNSVGKITKKFSGCLKEMLTDADNFEIIFPDDATPEDKLMLIGTALMIDFRYFEDNERAKNKNNRLLYD